MIDLYWWCWLPDTCSWGSCCDLVLSPVCLIITWWRVAVRLEFILISKIYSLLVFWSEWPNMSVKCARSWKLIYRNCYLLIFHNHGGTRFFLDLVVGWIIVARSRVAVVLSRILLSNRKSFSRILPLIHQSVLVLAGTGPFTYISILINFFRLKLRML